MREGDLGLTARGYVVDDTLVPKDLAFVVAMYGRAEQAIEHGITSCAQSHLEVAHRIVRFDFSLKTVSLGGICIQCLRVEAQQLGARVLEELEKRRIYIEERAVAARDVNSVARFLE